MSGKNNNCNPRLNEQNDINTRNIHEYRNINGKNILVVCNFRICHNEVCRHKRNELVGGPRGSYLAYSDNKEIVMWGSDMQGANIMANMLAEKKSNK